MHQRLINRLFAAQLGETLEAYVDDMIVKFHYKNGACGKLEGCV